MGGGDASGSPRSNGSKHAGAKSTPIEVRRAEDRLVDDLVVARHARGAHA